MGILDTILGRTKPVGANLERLFALPGAAVTLQASEGLVSSGEAAVCFKPAVGQAFAATEEELRGLLELGEGAGGASTHLSEETDRYGYRWVVVSSNDVDELVTRTHFVNSTLQEHGYGPQLLCSVFSFRQQSSPEAPAPGAPGARAGSIYLVYLFKRGTFYPFAPAGGERRDNEAELRLKAVLQGELAIEADLDRWFPLWELPIS